MTDTAPPVLEVRAGGSAGQYWKDLWRYREMMIFLAWRDILVRYKQTVMGLAWSVIRPLLTMVVFTLVFSRIAKLPSEGGMPYAIVVGAATLPWQFFSNALNECSNSVIGNAGMISKVYFPRLVVPLSAMVVSFVDFLISFVVLFALMLAYKVVPSARIAFLPFFLMLATAPALGAGLWFAALNVKYRDFRYVVGFFLQFGIYISPVGYTSAMVPQRWRLLYSMNPMVGVIDGFRWCLLGGDIPIYWPGFIISGLLAVVLLMSGFWYFRKTERGFADVI